jgi:lysophospholipase
MNQAIIMQMPTTYSSEHTLNCQAQIDFWQQVEKGKLQISSQISLAYCSIRHPSSNLAVVVSNGRVESYEKYRELIFDIYQQGYSVYALDHRGQGLSSRLTHNPHKGHVDKFDDYLCDFAHFIDAIVKPAQHAALFLVGHSMGGAIGTLYMDKYPDIFKAAVFSAPMYGIRLPLHKCLIRWLAKTLDTSTSGKEPNYILGGSDYKSVHFDDNNLTHSRARYEHYRELYKSKPELQLGSPTNRWVSESLDACERAIEAARKIRRPLLILQATEDAIVDNGAQDQAVAGNCRLQIISGAAHEIFLEDDSIRNNALTQMFDFFTQPS